MNCLQLCDRCLLEPAKLFSNLLPTLDYIQRSLCSATDKKGKLDLNQCQNLKDIRWGFAHQSQWEVVFSFNSNCHTSAQGKRCTDVSALPSSLCKSPSVLWWRPFNCSPAMSVNQLIANRCTKWFPVNRGVLKCTSQGCLQHSVPQA